MPTDFEKEIILGTSSFSPFTFHFEKTDEKIQLPKKYIINHGATILFWEDGTKTVVKRCEDDEFNKRLGFLTAFFQYATGMSKNKANKFLHELEVEDEKNEEQINLYDLQIGDKVKVRKNLKAGERYGCEDFTDIMEVYRGKKATITQVMRIGTGKRYFLDIDYSTWAWTPEMLEIIENKPKHMKEDNNG